MIIPSVMVALKWEARGRRHWVLFFHLDSHAEANRCDQLRRATDWARASITDTDWVAVLGDRNFVQFDSQRESSSSTAWRPSVRMSSTWENWLNSLGGCVESLQPEFTWTRLAQSESGQATWTYEVLDVAATKGPPPRALPP